MRETQSTPVGVRSPRLIAHPGLLASLEVIEAGREPGAWISESAARRGGLGVGDIHRFDVGGVEF